MLLTGDVSSMRARAERLIDLVRAGRLVEVLETRGSVGRLGRTGPPRRPTDPYGSRTPACAWYAVAGHHRDDQLFTPMPAYTRRADVPWQFSGALQGQITSAVPNTKPNFWGRDTGPARAMWNDASTTRLASLSTG